ncbi:MAG: SulP family inorganic anion transporter [Crocinitomicaceae bacterium]|jgi:SulP family sulfate permease|nr:SulP family inorganic anion transporter [Crocinitomicaceae bacterium]MDG1741937.1 SulP family inorganic anion transporter [Crocinitomicaceae bacterium]
MKKIFNLFDLKQKVNYKNEVLSGLTVALALVPEAIAFALIAGLSPLTGLYAAFSIGLITSIFGGRPGMISGATGAIAVIYVGMIAIIKKTNPDISVEEITQYIFATVILAGLIQIGVGLLRLGKFIRLVPHPVMFGFVNGLAIVIFLAQMSSFKENRKDHYGNNAVEAISTNQAFHVNGSVVTSDKTNTIVYNLIEGKLFNIETDQYELQIVGDQVFDVEKEQVVYNYQNNTFYNIEKKTEVLDWLQRDQLVLMIGLVLLTMLIIWGLPKLTTYIPSSLAAIVVVALITIFGEIDTKTVGDIASIKGGFPTPSLPHIPYTWDTFVLIFPYALIVAGVGLIESLLTLNLIDEITQTRGNSNKECVAQGTANIASGFFLGMGGCAMIGQSLINISSGARARLSGIVASLGLLSFILWGAPIIEQLPMAALTGVMVMVSIGTFEWASLKVFGKMPITDVIVMIVVTLITVFLHNLALAVLIGVVISALAFAWESAIRIRARKYIDSNGSKHYEIYGPLFFGSVSVFSDKFDIENDPEDIIIDFSESKIVDMSAIEALNSLTERYMKAGKKIHLRHLSPDCQKLLKNADKIVEVNVMEDPTYHVAADSV